MRILKWTRRIRISICQPGKLAPFSILSWRPVVSIWMTSPFSDSIVFTVYTRKQRFQKASFSNRSTLESVFEWLRSLFSDRFRRCSVDDSRIRSKPVPFSFQNGLVWTGPKFRDNFSEPILSYVTDFKLSGHLLFPRIWRFDCTDKMITVPRLSIVIFCKR